MIAYRLLGPLDATIAGRAAELPGGKPRALLARLVLDAGRPVGVDSLVEALWGDRPPASAPKLVQAYVSQLRKALGADAIETRSPGYLLQAGRDATDLGRFEALAARALEASDPRERARLLREALSLWRGHPLAEFRREPFSAPAGARLDELRLDALALRIDAQLDLGESDGLVAELHQLVADEPLRERFRRQLMLALYRAGRQSEALEVFRDGRRLLVEQLGIEPGPALQRLELAILRHDPSLDSPTPAAVERGCVLCTASGFAQLLLPLGDGREIVVVELAAGTAELASASERLDRLRGSGVRVACFTSSDVAADLARLAAEQGAELLVVAEAPSAALLSSAPCDVAYAARPELALGPGPVLVPFGGRREEWAAVELGAWLARAHGRSLRLLGVEARGGSRDASRLLAAASLALQRFAGMAAEPQIVEPGAGGVLAQQGAAIVVSLPVAGLDETRSRLVTETRVPILLAHGGPRPSGLAPDLTLTRFSWSLT
jgi:DNA-binding SARP family transcriptional activator